MSAITDGLVQALDAESSISKSEVSRICQDLGEYGAEFPELILDNTTYP